MLKKNPFENLTNTLYFLAQKNPDSIKKSINKIKPAIQTKLEIKEKKWNF
jgi:hypothetical protein